MMTLLVDSPSHTEQIRPESVSQWVSTWSEVLRPSQIVWCNGSTRERHELIELMRQQGTIEALNPDLRPYSFVARSNPDDVARVESRTFVCSDKKSDAGPTNNWVDPVEMRTTLLELMDGAMAGRTLYVVPFSMGPIDSPMARFGVQLTDSPYVVTSLHLMVRVSNEVLSRIDDGAAWVKCAHTVGAPLQPGEKDVAWPCNDTKYISHFPEAREIWSFGSAYGGNALLPKKAFALRIASAMAKDEGWLAEHMLLVRVTSPQGKRYHFAAAFPSACGKTNFAMMQPTLDGWRIETLGDDIAWLAIGSDGRLRAINPEAGFFGVAPGTSYKTNPVAMDTLWGNTIFTNVAVTDDGDVWWEGMSKEVPAGLTNWKGERHEPHSGEPAAHPNARFTVAIDQCGILAEDWDEPDGVPIDGIIFGGRRASTVPLVVEARDWNHGVFIGSTIASEQTAAAEGEVGVVRRDPFAMLPFLGYHLGDYINHWLTMGERLRAGGRTPRIFQVNWFQKDDQGRFIWPGFGDNIRVVKWMVERLEGSVAAKDSPIGLLPHASDIDHGGLELNSEDLAGLLQVNHELISSDLEDAAQYLGALGKKLPAAISREFDAVRERLNS
jgi:phosphoenolpyruvate carboxykinase (GTP)